MASSQDTSTSMNGFPGDSRPTMNAHPIMFLQSVDAEDAVSDNTQIKNHDPRDPNICSHQPNKRHFICNVSDRQYQCGSYQTNFPEFRMPNNGQHIAFCRMPFMECQRTICSNCVSNSNNNEVVISQCRPKLSRVSFDHITNKMSDAQEDCSRVSVGTATTKLSLDPNEELKEAAQRILTSIVPPKIYRENSTVLSKTPQRFANTLQELTFGYTQDPKEIIQSAKFPLDRDPMSFKYYASTTVSVKDIPFSSLCEHHLLPFQGNCSIAYIPDYQVLGLSKFSRVVNAFSKRLQIQERLTRQICRCLFDELRPLALLVIMKAIHGCVSLRGVCDTSSNTTTRSFLCHESDDDRRRDIEIVLANTLNKDL